VDHPRGVVKAWTTDQTDDLSLKMLLVMSTGIALWVGYGVLREDLVIVLANGASLVLLAGLLYFKLQPSS
jgi:MtN3 and saliva related transmembrane protein